MRYGLAASVMGAAMVLATVPAHAEKNAVSQFNAKAEGFASLLSEGEGYGGAGSVTFPVLEGLGVQVDGLAGALDGEFTYGIGGHFFWRAPSTGMFGVVVSYMDADNLYDVFRAAFEGEWYFDDLTLGGTVGYQDVDYKPLDSAFFAGANATFYPDDDVAITLDVTGLGFDSNEDYQFTGGVEFGITSGVSLFAAYKLGTESDDYATAGIRIALFGSGDTLKHRDRYDDPSNVLTRSVRETEYAIELIRDAE